jgi:gluconate 2-dehydrogenase gamma chain
MMPHGLSRREVLLYSSAAALMHAGDAHKHAGGSSASEVRKLQFFTEEDAADVEAVASLIIPSDETPGAREAGVIHFIDAGLATFDRDKQSIYREGLEQIRREVASLAPGRRHVADLDREQQLQLMKRIAGSEYFGVIRTHTVMGFMGSPARGGNKDETGWKLIGFEDKFTFQPPFGYYDSEAHGGDPG